ncbi:STAS domain-containing protein [Umezawaea sp. Da 62-37]|uniref:STAS domain-containing protein n=1 Tax=Umezawaea sp. Da 62-37 TaxID=3075927 RepID=UPI0028F7449F|nr:STAS domain-containing protein [Umezawaea sp. Da 62-37]WNV86024.1 STAS domain-containing protein [Umezawaea sp. Da 62-37]
MLLTEDVLPAGQVRCTFDEDLPRVALTGEVDMDTDPQFDAAYAELAGRAPTHVVVDLAGVTFLSCSGLTFVARLNLHLGRTGHRVWLVSPTRMAARVLGLTGFTWDADVPAAALT